MIAGMEWKSSEKVRVLIKFVKWAWLHLLVFFHVFNSKPTIFYNKILKHLEIFHTLLMPEIC